MAGLKLRLIVPIVSMVGAASSIAVTPDSPCTQVCLDTPSQNSTGAQPVPTNTYASDISCVDSAYYTTPVGEKYKSCVSCLQLSAATGDGQSDQAWFLYNLRYSLDVCLFGFGNTSSVSSPCTTSGACLPLQTALEDGNLDPDNDSEYSYCTADSNAIRGSNYDRCDECLRNTGDQRYLSNFLRALSAGCDQEVGPGVLIGIDGTVFSDVPVNSTYPGYNQTSATHPAKKKGLNQSAVIGIVAGLVILSVITATILFFVFRKQKERKQLKALQSPLDSRFGAQNITSPTSGAYGNPYSRQINQAAQPFDQTSFSQKELEVLNNAQSVLAKHQISTEMQHPNDWQDAHAHLANSLPAYTGSKIPTHQAYVNTRGQYSSPASTGSFQMSPYPSSWTSSQVSPTDLLPPLQNSPNIPPSTRQSPHIPPPIQVPHQDRPAPVQITSEIHYTSDPPNYSPPDHNDTPIEPPIRSWSQAKSIKRGKTAAPLELQQVNEQESSVVYPPRNFYTDVDPIETRPLSRTHSRAESWKRGTRALGIGNANASADGPVNISGPMHTHGGRFDFELAQRERRLKEQLEGRQIEYHKKEATPVSAESEEQWPGSY